MNFKHGILYLLAGWLLSLIISPAALMSMFSGFGRGGNAS